MPRKPRQYLAGVPAHVVINGVRVLINNSVEQFVMKHLTAISFVFLFCSDMLMASGSNLGDTKNSVIEPGKSYEACMWLSPGDRLYYEFTSSANLLFNIHYHEGKEVQYPVQIKLTSLEKAIFEPESRKHYCLMWENPVKKRVELNLHYQRRNSGDN